MTVRVIVRLEISVSIVIFRMKKVETLVVVFAVILLFCYLKIEIFLTLYVHVAIGCDFRVLPIKLLFNSYHMIIPFSTACLRLKRETKAVEDIKERLRCR